MEVLRKVLKFARQHFKKIILAGGVYRMDWSRNRLETIKAEEVTMRTVQP